MTTIGGPGGIGGPKGPGGPEGPAEASELSEPSEVADITEIAGDAAVEQAQGAARASDVEALAAEVAAGRLTQREAIDRLVDATAGPGLSAAERAELRELLTDLVANDPYLGGLVGRI
jgi:hypothetical protein